MRTYSIRRVFSPALQVLLLHALSSPAFSVIVSDSIDDHRVVPGTVSYGVNLDGVVRLQLDGQTGCNAALISDRHLLSAAHCFDSDEEAGIDISPDTVFQVVFERPSGKVTKRFTGADVTRPASWPEERSADIAVIRLSREAPAEIPRYPIYGGRDEVGSAIVIVGHGYTGTGLTGRGAFLDEKLAGLNRYDALGDGVDGDEPRPPDGMLAYDFDGGSDENNTLAAWGYVSDLGFGDDEAKGAEGDSGSPVFINGAIAGVISFGQAGFETDLLPGVKDTWGEVGYDTRVSSFVDFVLDATDGKVVVVPEPSGVRAFCLGVSIVWLRLLCTSFRKRPWPRDPKQPRRTFLPLTGLRSEKEGLRLRGDRKRNLC